MKTINYLATIILTASLLIGCTIGKSSDLKLTIVPASPGSSITSADLNKTAGVLVKRMENLFNIPEKDIQFRIADDKISLTISNIDSAKTGQIKEAITGYHRLELRETYQNGEIKEYLKKVNDKLREIQNPGNTGKGTEINPLFDILKPEGTMQSEPVNTCMTGLVNINDTSKINAYFRMDAVKTILPRDLKFYWSANPNRYDPSKSKLELHVIKVKEGDSRALITGSSIISAQSVKGSDNSNVKIRLTMDDASAGIWSEMTKENMGRCIAVIYDGYVRSYPRVMAQITGGKTEITGSFSADEANTVAAMLSSGDLPFKLQIVNAEIVRR
jgi:SecD/SecF fusion protein